MDWFLYDKDLRHERVNRNNENKKRLTSEMKGFGVVETIRFMLI